MLQYTGEPLMDVPSEAELVAQDRERILYEFRQLERMRADLDSGRRALAAEREQLGEVMQWWRERESVLAQSLPSRQPETIAPVSGQASSDTSADESEDTTAAQLTAEATTTPRLSQDN